MDGLKVSNLVNSGCGQIFIHQGLIRTSDSSVRVIQLQCIQGDVKPYLSAQVSMTVNGVMRVMTVGLTPRLAYPVILRYNWGKFTEVLCDVILSHMLGWSSREIHLKERMACPRTQAGQPANPNEGVAPAPPACEESLSLGTDFSAEQWEDPTLSQAYEPLACVNVEVTKLHRVTQCPCFELTGNCLYRINRDPWIQ